VARTVLGGHDSGNPVLFAGDVENHKPLPDFEITACRLEVAVVDIRRSRVL
jgi:hypothetical protein